MLSVTGLTEMALTAWFVNKNASMANAALGTRVIPAFNTAGCPKLIETLLSDRLIMASPVRAGLADNIWVDVVVAVLCIGEVAFPINCWPLLSACFSQA
jgi:hypothetical protein